jgi:hypothetical protein
VIKHRSQKIWIALVLLLAGGCYTFECHDDLQCHDSEGRLGLCLAYRDNRYCTIPSPTCPSGWRWKVSADGDIADTCVRPEYLPPDGGGADAMTAPPDLGGGGE